MNREQAASQLKSDGYKFVGFTYPPIIWLWSIRSAFHSDVVASLKLDPRDANFRAGTLLLIRGIFSLSQSSKGYPNNYPNESELEIMLNGGVNLL